MKKKFLFSVTVITSTVIIVTLSKMMIREVNTMLEGMRSEKRRWTYP